MDDRKNVKLDCNVKQRISELKRHMKFKTESETIAYLATLYDFYYPKITLPQHEAFLENVKVMHNQGGF